MRSARPRRTLEEARAIARALRRQYITPEAEAMAKIALRRMGMSEDGSAFANAFTAAMVNAPAQMPSRAKPPSPVPPILQDSPDTLIRLIRKREEIDMPKHVDDVFSDEERERAQRILADLQRRYPTRQ